MNKLIITLILVLFIYNTPVFNQPNKTPLIYGGDANYPPYEYLNKEGQPEGFNIDVIKALAVEMQIKIKFKLDQWSTIRKELEETENIDISDMFYSAERDSLVDFSIPFTIAYDEIFIRQNTTGINSLDDIKGKKVIVQNMSFIYDKLKKNYPSAELIIVENEPAALLMLSSGKGDCAILSQTVTRTIVQAKDYSNIVRAGSPIFPKEYAFVVKNGNSELLRIINNGLLRLKDKKILDEIESKWFGQKEKYESVREFLTYLIYVLVILIIVTAVVIVWNRTLKKQVRLKTDKLIDTHTKLTDTLENMDEGFYWVNEDWVIANINNQAANLFGRNYKDLLNENLWQQFPLIKQYVYSEYMAALKTKKPVNIEFFFEPEQKWYENRIIPSQNGLAVFVKEITDKKKAEELIKESESNLKSLIENWTEAIWAIDKNYRFIIFNTFFKQRFYELYKQPLSKGMSAIDFISKDQKEFWKNKYDAAFSGKRLTFEIPSNHKNTKKYYEVFLNPIIIDDVVKGVSVFRIDITSSKLREIQLTEAKENAEKSDKLKTEFLAQVSHEIRTPINNILNYTGLLIDSCSAEKEDEHKMVLESIESSSKRIMRTIDLILNMSEIQLGSYNSIIKKIDLINEVIKPVIKEYSYSAGKKNILLTFSTEYGKLYVNGDLYSLSQIISNLVDNAIKYTNQGEVRVKASLNDDGEIEVSVADTGVGISEDFLPCLFEPFRQEEQGYTRSYDGNGVGLALVKKYCEINKVGIEVKSLKSSGTTFYLFFEHAK